MNYAHKAQASITAALQAQAAAMLDVAAAFAQDMRNACDDRDRTNAADWAQERLGMLYGRDGAAKMVAAWLQQEQNERARKQRESGRYPYPNH